MPPVIVGVVVAAGAVAVVGTTVATAIAIGLAAAALYTVATMKIPKAPGTPPSDAKKMIRSPNQPFRTIYGTAMVSGPIVFAEEYLHESGYEDSYEHCGWKGDKNDREYVCEIRTRWIDTSTKWLHLVLPLAAHPCHEVSEVYFNDKLQEEWNHDYWKINVLDGTQTSISQIPELLRAVPSWTDNMIGKGVTWIHVALRHSTTHFPNGIPNVKCLVKGKSVSTPFFTGFTNNAAAVMYDFLVSHFKAKPKEINLESFQNDYAVCGEVMDNEVEPPANPEDPAPTPPIRYAIDGIFDWDEPHENVMQKMKSACGGKLIFTNGQYHLQVAAYRGPVPTAQVISLSDLNGPVNILPDVARAERVNKVTGQHLDPERFYQQVDFTPVTNQEYLDQDGEEMTTDLNLEYVLNKHQAHRLANILLKDNRFGITLEVPMNLRGFKFNVGLPVRFDEKELGYDQLEFMVVSWRITEKNGLVLKLKQTSPDIFDDSIATVSPKPPSTNLPDPAFCYPPYQLVFVQEEDDGTYDGILTWAHPDINNVSNFQVIATSVGGEIFKYNTGKDMELRMQDMRGVDYTVNVIAYNLNRSPSEPATITAKIGAPKAIVGVDFDADNFELTIKPKVSGVLPITTTFNFFKADTDIPDPDEITLIGSGVSYTDVGLEPARTYNYFIQAINSSASSELYGPFSATTTNNPDKIYDFIKDEIPGQYTWICYASDAFGANISATLNPAVHKFEGRAYNKATEAQSLNPADYAFRRIGDFISPEEQEVLDNLGQGKLPDGSGDLISADDVLFKPGDLVQGGQIAEGAITAPNLAIDSVTTDKVVVGAITVDKVSAGAITAPKLAIGAVTTEKLDIGAVTVDKVSAGAITAPKLAIDSVTVDKISNGAITTEKVSVGAIESPNLADEAVVSDKLAANAVIASKISAGAVQTDKLSANAVTAAKIASDTITANQIAAGAITASELATNSVIAGKIAANAVTANTISAGAIETEKLAANAVTAVNLAADSVTANAIKAGAIETDKLAANAVTAAKIAADTITANQIAAGAITASELATNSVVAGKVAANAITANTISSGAVETDKLAANAVTAAKIASDTITANQIAAGAITASELATNSVTAGKIAANAVTANTIVSGTITGDKLAANTITASQIATDTITANKIAAGAITASELATNSVIAGKIATDAVTANTIAAGQITSVKIATGAITADKIEAGAVGADKITANAITTAKIDTGAITADKIAANAVTASKILANQINANHIQAGAITADKIAVTVVSPINNISESGNTNGWGLQSNVSLVNTVVLGGSAVGTLQFAAVPGQIIPPTYTTPFTIDHNAVYEVTTSVWHDGLSGSQFFLRGLARTSTGTTDTVDRYHAVTLSLNDSTSAPSFYSGPINGWRNSTCYIVGANADISAVPKSFNATYILKLRSSTRTFSLGANATPGSATTELIHLYSPSIIKVGSGKIVAEEIRANVSISAPTINGGVINGGEINGATGNFAGSVKAGNLVGVVNAVKRISLDALTIYQYETESGGTEKIAVEFKVKRDELKSQMVYLRMPSLFARFVAQNSNNNNTFYTWDDLAIMRDSNNGVAVPGDLRINTDAKLEVKLQLDGVGQVDLLNDPVFSEFMYYNSIINQNLANPSANNRYNYYIYKSTESSFDIGPISVGFGDPEEELTIRLMVSLRMTNLSTVPIPPGGLQNIELYTRGGYAYVTSTFIDDGHITQV